MLLLKGMGTNIVVDGLLHFKLQRWDSSLKGARDMWRGIELSGFWVRLEGQISFR